MADESLLSRIAVALDDGARRNRPVLGARPLPETATRPATARPGTAPLAAASPDWLEAQLARARLARDGGAYVARLGDAARRDAAAVDPGAPLAGFALAVKDLIALAGRPVGGGSAVRDGAPAEPGDAPVVARLRRAGAVVVGATALHELAFGVTGLNEHGGTPRNPLDPTLLPGGSSSGSAVAVAEGSARIALGTDTGGSVRIPSALCGVAGFKPARDALPPAGVHPLSPTLDHVGFHAASVADLRAVAAALDRPSPERERPLVLGIATAELEAAAPPIAGALDTALRALERAGCTLRPVSTPDPEAVFAATTAIMFAEAAAIHAADLRECPERFGPDVRARLEIGAAIPATAYLAARERRTRLMRVLDELLCDVDALVGPTLAIEPPPLERGRDAATAARLVANTRLANLTGAPALTLPLGPPGVALQLTARTDAAALSAAAWAEPRLG